MALGEVRIGNAPVSYGVFGQAAGGPGASPTMLLDTIADAGYVGSELGPPGFFGTPEETAAAFEARHLAVIGGYVPLHLGAGDEALIEADLAAMRRTAAELVAAGSGGWLILADEGDAALRTQAPRGPGDAALALDAAGWTRLAARLEQALAVAAAFGLAAVFHPHVGTYVESPTEVDRLLDASEVALAFDSGHIALGGGDVVGCARRWRERIAHVHVKDVDLGVLARVKAGVPQDLDAWFGGVCRPLGAGDLDLPGLFEVLSGAGYAGWMVVEQDRDPTPLEDYPGVAAQQAANYHWLAQALAER